MVAASDLFFSVMALAAVYYYLGVILYALPSGRRMRRMGKQMMYDSSSSLWVLMLFSSPAFALNLISFLGFGSTSGAYDQILFPWLGVCHGHIATPQHPCGSAFQTGLLQSQISGVITISLLIVALYAVQVAVAIVFGVVAAAFEVTNTGIVGWLIGAVGSFLGGVTGVLTTYAILGFVPVLTLAPAAMFLTVGIYYLAEFVRQYWTVTMSVGAWLYVLPFKVGRKYGAALVALSLVLYVGLPLMPGFVGFMGSPGNAQQALDVLQSSNGNLLQAAGELKPSDAFFSVGSLGPVPTDYFAMHVTGVSGVGAGKTWTIWTDKHGFADYPLPSGTYQVTDVSYLFVPVTFEKPPVFAVATANEMGLDIPVDMAQVHVAVGAYMWNFSKAEFTPSAGTLTFNMPYFLDAGSVSGALMANFTQVSQTMINATVCPTTGSDEFSFAMFIPSSNQVDVTVNGEAASFREVSANQLGGLTQVTAPVYGCSVLVIQAGKVVPWAPWASYVRQNIDALGYAPPQLTADQQTSLTASLDFTEYYFVIDVLLPTVYLFVVLGGTATGLARLLARRQ
jgi:hypothetical protein